MSPSRLGARAAADALAAGTLSSVELVRSCLEAIEAANPRLNAFLHVDAEGALAAARASDARRAGGEAWHPLDGLPVAIKDNIAVAGMPLTVGLASRRGQMAAEDAWCVRKLRKAGAVILGKTHVVEGSLGAGGDNPHYGDCANPAAPGFSPGGSSCGSAAVLAASLCPLALGSDTLGSVRIPAAWCGVVGFKPSAGRVTRRGMVPASRWLDHIGPMARSAGDLGLIYQQIAGADAGDPGSRAVVLDHHERPWSTLKVGFVPDAGALALDPAVARSYAAAVARIGRQAGAMVEVDLAGWDAGKARRAGLLICEAELISTLAADLAVQGADAVSPRLRAMLDWGAARSAVELAAAQAWLDRATLLTRLLFRQVDVLVLPTTPNLPFALDTPEPVTTADLTALANFAGVPALTVPIEPAADGRPIGLQLIGPIGSDLVLLALGEALARVD